jgi:ribokinase
VKKITVVGSISMDLVTTTQRVPEAGETVFGETFSMMPGGKGANQAIAAARLAPHQVTMIGNVGLDTFGESLLKNFEENQLFFGNVGTIPHQSTGLAQITVYGKDNRIIIIPGANTEVTTKNWEKEWQILEQSDLVILQNEIPHVSNLAIAKFCRQKQVKLLYNPAPARVTDAEMLDYVDYVTPNEHEFHELFPEMDLAACLRAYPNKLIVTLGESGVIFFDGKEIQKIPAIKAKVVDTTGAGDTFNGAFAVALINNLKLKEAIKFAVLASYLSVQKFGAQGGMPTLQEMMEDENYEETWAIK